MKNKKHLSYQKCKDQKLFNKDWIKKKQEENYNMKHILKLKNKVIRKLYVELYQNL